MYLGHIKIVDMKHSKWDKQKSDPAKGKYIFTDKKYVDYNDTSRKLDYFWQWGDKSGQQRMQWEYGFHYSVVKPEDKLFWPEGVSLDKDGEYSFGDAVLMKIKIDDYKAKRLPEIEASERATKATLEGFAHRVRADAERAGIPHADITKMVDDIILDERRGGTPPSLLKSKKLT